MFEEFNICPYPGLRSFTEEESIYFKGREEQISEIIRLLSRNKFLLITGASGDGKSSMVYAGLIPNARAGFFRSRYNNWVVADFRPERDPLANLAQAIHDNLGISSKESVEVELSRGYSSLIDLYKSSPLYSGNNEESRENANLLILVDQFEELFTNPENYQDGVPSNASQTTVNLILETARIALEEELPIYVVCTMRSDFIGQCASFRGLPEYIGFSQFFVPRLKRKEIQQIIEEPADLSGNQISRRLVERLIYDLTEGIDQLPILQHALSQIWIAANNGAEEMDLLHYAMVGGMPVEELPEADQDKFNQWFKSIPHSQQISYDYSSLENVLDIHANKLYEGAAEEYRSTYNEDISVQDAKNVIAIAFACLTKVDQSRTVRNRMTLDEITRIINIDYLDTIKVGRVLNIFRKEGNTFIRPFIMEGDQEDIPPDTVLDITHESLIRNWKRLLKWVKKEYSFYEDFNDFKKQLDRWLANGKSRNYLLPIGPLTYFENWYQECRPNPSWIARYLKINKDEDNLVEATKILKETNEFLRKSSNKHIVTRTIIKYGPQKIGVFISILLTIVLSSFYYVDALKKQNERVLEEIKSQSADLINIQEDIPFFNQTKAFYLFSLMRSNPERCFEIIETIDDPRLKVEVSVAVLDEILSADRYFKGDELNRLLEVNLQNLNTSYEQQDIEPFDLIKNLNNYTTLLVYNHYYDERNESSTLLKSTIELQFKALTRLFKGDPVAAFDIEREMAKTIRSILNHGTEQMAEELAQLISPFGESREVFDYYFPQSSTLPNGARNLSHNGGYQLMAEVYAATSQYDKSMQAMDSVLAYTDKKDYFWYQTLNNYNTIASYFLKKNDVESLEKFYRHLVNLGLSPDIFFRDLVDRIGFLNPVFYSTNLDYDFRSHPGDVNPASYFVNVNTLDFIQGLFFDYLDNSGKGPDFVNFRKAVFLKNKALITNRYKEDKGQNVDPEYFDKIFSEAFSYYENVSDDFRDEIVPFIYRYYSDGYREPNLPRHMEMLYPDWISGWNTYRYTSSVMVKWLLQSPAFEQFYNETGKLDLFLDWVSVQYEVATDGDIAPFFNMYTQDVPTLDSLHAKLISANLDVNYLNVVLAHDYLENDNKQKAGFYLDRIDREKITENARRQEYLNYNAFMNFAFDITIDQYLTDPGLGSAYLEKIEQPQYKTLAYLDVADMLYDSPDPELSFRYLDSAMSVLKTYNPSDVRGGFLTTDKFLRVLARIGGDDFEVLGKSFLKQNYPGGLFQQIVGDVQSQNYYMATTRYPRFWTPLEELRTNAAFIYLASLNTQQRANWQSVDKYIQKQFIDLQPRFYFE